MGAKLLFALLAAATNCHTFYYGTSYDLSKKGRVIAWPIDEEGKQFRYTIDHIPRPLREWGASPRIDSPSQRTSPLVG